MPTEADKHLIFGDVKTAKVFEVLGVSRLKTGEVRYSLWDGKETSEQVFDIPPLPIRNTAKYPVGSTAKSRGAAERGEESQP